MRRFKIKKNAVIHKSSYHIKGKDYPLLREEKNHVLLKDGKSKAMTYTKDEVEEVFEAPKRLFMMVGDQESYGPVIKQNKTYPGDLVPWTENGKPSKVFPSHDNVVKASHDFPNDWKEVTPTISSKAPDSIKTDTKQNHKDTDLGHFAGLVLQGLSANWNSFDLVSEGPEFAIHIAKKMIKNLDDELDKKS